MNVHIKTAEANLKYKTSPTVTSQLGPGNQGGLAQGGVRRHSGGQIMKLMKNNVDLDASQIFDGRRIPQDCADLSRIFVQGHRVVTGKSLALAPEVFLIVYGPSAVALNHKGVDPVVESIQAQVGL